jgi:hypothetical protein
VLFVTSYLPSVATSSFFSSFVEEATEADSFFELAAVEEHAASANAREPAHNTLVNFISNNSFRENSIFLC